MIFQDQASTDLTLKPLARTSTSSHFEVLSSKMHYSGSQMNRKTRTMTLPHTDTMKVRRSWVDCIVLLTNETNESFSRKSRSEQEVPMLTVLLLSMRSGLSYKALVRSFNTAISLTGLGVFVRCKSQSEAIQGGQ